jgi:hypothetical protein
MSSMPAEIYMTSLQLAHHRAVLAVMSANPRATEAQAVELADSMSALVMETLKHFLDREDEPCN